MSVRRWVGVVVTLAACLAVPAAALAHPLGNFTINHYAGIRVAPDGVRLDVVIDMAEIPTFQERQRLDTDLDGVVGPAELAAERAVACPRLAPSLSLTIGGARRELTVTGAGLTFAPGAGDLPTMRLVCEFEADLATRLTGDSTIAFADSSYAERIGWREIVVEGDGVTVSAVDVHTTSVSNRLTGYPSDLLSQPLDMRSVEFGVRPGGPALPAWSAPDAAPVRVLAGAVGLTPGGVTPAVGLTPGGVRGVPGGIGGVPGGIGGVPGGIGGELASLIGTADLTLPVILASLLVAMGLGALHALSPGHGKTVMAAYLVGSRGTARHAVALGLTVTVAHTLGVLMLAVLTVLASSVLPPERLYPILGLASGGIVVAIGGSLLFVRYRQWIAARQVPDRPRGPDRAHDENHHAGVAHSHGGGFHSHGGGFHSHDGGVPHSHLPPTGTTLSWRGLVALGLAGGLVPSASALILLLGSVAVGRVEFGLTLVVAFGAGMAVVLGGVGLALVHAGRLVERVPVLSPASWLGRALPIATAVVVLAAGVLLTGQAVTQVF